MTQSQLLDTLEADLRAAIDELRTHFVNAPEEALRLRPNPEGWTALECFAHLNQELKAYVPKMELAIHKAKARKWEAQTELDSTHWGRRDLARVQSDNTKPFRTGKKRNFGHQPLGPGEAKNLAIYLEQLRRVVQTARSIDLNKPTIARQFNYFGSYTLGDALQYVIAHVRRHLRQALATQVGAMVV